MFRLMTFAAHQTAAHHHQDPNLRMYDYFSFLAFKCYLNELKIILSHFPLQDPKYEQVFWEFPDQCYMFRLMTF